MSLLKDIYFCMDERHHKPSPAYWKASDRQHTLMQKVEAIDPQLAEELVDSFCETSALECEELFFLGLKLGLELLKL